MNAIDRSARVSSLADLERSERGSRIVIGARTMVDAFVKMKFAGGAGDIEIGADCAVNSGCVFYSGHGIRIANAVLVAANCTFAATNHAFSDKERRIRDQGFMPSRGGIVVEEDVWIGANCVLLDGASIGRGAVIAAGSVVREAVQAFTIAAGAPARIIGERGAR